MPNKQNRNNRKPKTCPKNLIENLFDKTKVDNDLKLLEYQEKKWLLEFKFNPIHNFVT